MSGASAAEGHRLRPTKSRHLAADKWWLVLAVVSAVVLAAARTGLFLSDVPLHDDVIFAAASLGPLVVGSLLIIRVPGHSVGRLLAAIGASWALGEATRLILWIDLHVGPLPSIDLAAWLQAWLPVLQWLLLPMLLTVFPSGRVESSWLRSLVWVGIAAMLLIVVLAMIVPGTLGLPFAEDLSNPWAIEALAPLAESRFGMVAETVISLTFFLVAMSAIADLLLRWRRSEGAERVQMRWFGFSVVVLVVLLAGSAAATAAGVATFAVGNALVVIGITALPLAIGVAVTRYGLYEIDRLISRTITYFLVVGILAAVYVLGLIGIQGLLPASNDIAVAASTLAAVGLFNPLRRRIHHLVDRRFNRARYDAQAEVDRFAERLRTHIDHADLTGDLLGVVSGTVQPSTTGIWVRDESHRT